MAALYSASRLGGPDGVLRTAEAFAHLGNREMVLQGLPEGSIAHDPDVSTFYQWSRAQSWSQSRAGTCVGTARRTD